MPGTVEEIITQAAARAVGGCLQWNVHAYGKAWTGEGEDTDFLVSEVAREVVTALHDNGLHVAALAEDGR